MITTCSSFVVHFACVAECVRLRDDLADLQTEISIKERLVEELERSERRLMEVRIMYERKLAELSMRITATEAERDRVLCEMGKRDTVVHEIGHLSGVGSRVTVIR